MFKTNKKCKARCLQRTPGKLRNALSIGHGRENVNNVSEKLSTIISVKDRVSVSVDDSNSNNSDRVLLKQKRTLREVQAIAYKLESRLGRQYPSRFPYYCKVAWRLPDFKIWGHLEAATGPSCRSTPAQLFAWLCEQEEEMQ